MGFKINGVFSESRERHVQFMVKSAQGEIHCHTGRNPKRGPDICSETGVRTVIDKVASIAGLAVSGKQKQGLCGERVVCGRAPKEIA